MRYDWSSVGILAVAVLGHLALARESLAWLHDRALPHRIWVLVVCVAVAAMAALPLVMVRKVGLRGPAVLYGGAWDSVPAVWLGYMAFCGVGLVGVAGRRLLRRDDSGAVRTRRLDLAAGRGHRSYGPGLKGWLARSPGIELLALEISERELELSRLPDPWRGLSILHLSDTHLNGTPGRAYFERACALAQELQPDLIALTGDVVDRIDVLDWLPTTLGRLRAPLGCYFVLGNHDIDRFTIRRRDALIGLGWTDLGGRWVERKVRGQRLVLAGSEVPWAGTAPEPRWFRGWVPRAAEPRPRSAEMGEAPRRGPDARRPLARRTSAAAPGWGCPRRSLSPRGVPCPTDGDARQPRTGSDDAVAVGMPS